MIKQIFSQIGIILFSGLTVASGGMGVYKIINQPASVTLPNQELTQTSSPSATPAIDNQNSNPIGSNISSQDIITTTPTLSQNPNANNSNNNRCIITLWNKQYDVTPLRSQHPGGDIFVCGTDMTAVYQSQHGTNLSRMQPYLISGNITVSNPNITNNSVTPTPVANNNSTTNVPTNSCIITLFGQQYNVTPLRSQHPGGDIFVCGTDMTSIYQAQHGTDLSRMQPYLISSNTTGSVNNGAFVNQGTQNPQNPQNKNDNPKSEDDDHGESDDKDKNEKKNEREKEDDKRQHNPQDSKEDKENKNSSDDN